MIWSILVIQRNNLKTRKSKYVTKNIGAASLRNGKRLWDRDCLIQEFEAQFIMDLLSEEINLSELLNHIKDTQERMIGN
jgi:hypothetical protein